MVIGTCSRNRELAKSVNKNELQEAINQMKNEKSPGIDGIPIEFYKTLQELLENDLLQFYKNILFIEKDITNTMNQAIVTLILKKRRHKEIEISETNFLNYALTTKLNKITLQQIKKKFCYKLFQKNKHALQLNILFLIKFFK